VALAHALAGYVETLGGERSRLVAEARRAAQTLERDLGIPHRLAEPEADGEVAALLVAAGHFIVTGDEFENFLGTIVY